MRARSRPRTRREAVERGIELFDGAARTELLRAHEAASSLLRAGCRRWSPVSRRTFDVITRAGRARQRRHRHRRDRSGAAARRARAHDRRAPAHPRPARHRRRHLRLQPASSRFYNAAYRSLWDLDAALSRPGPDRFGGARSAARRPQAARRARTSASGRPALHEAYRAIEPKEHVWHLPDGRTMRVVTTPNPEGGVIYLFDDVTERLDLERRYDALIRVQGETLDNLAEAVAVFGSDGRLRLFNPAFARMWRLEPASARRAAAYRGGQRLVPAAARRRSDLAEPARDHHGDRQPRAGHRPARAPRRQRGRLRHHAAAGRRHAGDLPGRHRHRQCRACAARAQRGAGDGRQAQDRLRPPRLLRAALAAHQHHRLRALPRRPGDRPADREAARIPRLHHRLDQRAARDHQQHPRPRHHRRRRHDAQSRRRSISARPWRPPPKACRTAWSRTASSSTSAPRRTSAASSPTSGACASRCSISWPTRWAFRPRARPLRFRPSGCTDAVVFSVTDRGPGIPADVQDRVFDWFETHSLGSRHRGTGLGLSLVRSFVELHGGTVTLESAVGRGTTVTCVFPIEQAASEPRRDPRLDAANCAARCGFHRALPAIPVRMPAPDRRMTPSSLRSMAMSWRCP